MPRPARSRRNDVAAVACLVVGLVLGLICHRLWSIARASADTAYPITVSAGEYALFGGGAFACLALAVMFALRARRRSRRRLPSAFRRGWE